VPVPMIVFVLLITCRDMSHLLVFDLRSGADFRNYTYAKYGHIILRQPGQFAWQIFDQKVVHLLRDEYRIREVFVLFR
jgi:hypothetical protein